jgi:hypothetical protein
MTLRLYHSTLSERPTSSGGTPSLDAESLSASDLVWLEERLVEYRDLLEYLQSH